MLKITIAESAKEESWTLCGRLIAPWVDELKETWKKEHRETKARKCIVNLDEVTFIDKSGERMLRSMMKQGARFVANDLYIRHVLDRVKGRPKRKSL
jgi:anti-anti-sigma regulatory factor